MQISLRGSSVRAATTGILLLTRARQLGLRIQVRIAGDPSEITTVPGPALVHAPILASCGVGREAGYGSTVVVPGPAGSPLPVSVEAHGLGGWFQVDRTQGGACPATTAFVRLSRDPRVPARHLAKQLRRAMQAVGMAPEPAVVDILCAAPTAPLTRLALALRAGRVLSNDRGQPITRFLTGAHPAAQDPLPADQSPAALLAAATSGQLDWVLDKLSPAVRDPIEAWVQGAARLSREDEGRDLVLLQALVEIATHLVQLPSPAILPPLSAAEDAIAVGLARALDAEGALDGNRKLVETYRFLGGRFSDPEPHTVDLGGSAPPEDPADRWPWMCREAWDARQRARSVWRDLLDPPQ